MQFLSLKDLFIALTLIILLLCIREIRRLKVSVAREVQKRLTPQLILELVPGLDKQAGFYLHNISPFLIRDIAIDDVVFILEDFGFNLECILRFNHVEFLKPRERTLLAFSLLNEKGAPREKLTDAAIAHLRSPDFKVTIHYANIENLRFSVVFGKKGEKF